MVEQTSPKIWLKVFLYTFTDILLANKRTCDCYMDDQSLSFKYKTLLIYLFCVAIIVAYMIPGCNEEKGWSKA